MEPAVADRVSAVGSREDHHLVRDSRIVGKSRSSSGLAQDHDRGLPQCELLENEAVVKGAGLVVEAALWCLSRGDLGIKVVLLELEGSLMKKILVRVRILVDLKLRYRQVAAVVGVLGHHCLARVSPVA